MRCTCVEWIGSFATLCESDHKSDKEIRAEYWYGVEEESGSDETHGSAPIPEERRSDF